MISIKKITTLLLSVLCTAVLSCHKGHDHEHEDHHHGTIITQYSNTLELYGEMQPFIVGQDCDQLIHLTKLSNFKPLDSTKVTMILTIEGKEQKNTVNQPEKAGLYNFCITPAQTGCGSLRFEIAWADSIETIKAGHIHVFKNAKEAEKGAHTHQHAHSHADGEHHHHEGEHSHSHADGEHHHHEGEHSHSHADGEHHHEDHQATSLITFTKEQSWKVDFATAELHPCQFGQIIKATAQVLPSQGDEREVTAKTSGIVVFTNATIVEGASVSASQRLFSIESSGMADNNLSVRYQEALSDYTLAKQEYERKSKLADDKIVSQSELIRSRNELERAEANYNNLKRNFSQGSQAVSSPMSGFIKSIHVKNGAYVEAGEPIVTVSQNRDLFIRADIQPRYYTYLQHISGANFVLNGEVYDIDQLGGGLVSYGRSTSADNPLIPVTFRFRNQVNLLSGSFVTLYIRTLSDHEVITIPNTGIIEEMGSKFVFVQHTPESFEKRPVEVGATDGKNSELKSGVTEGERVVTRGAMMVKLAQSSGALDPHAGHHH